MIEGKLIQQQYQPQNVQVIIQGKDDAAAMVLVNENGVIKHIKPHNLHAHVTSSPGLARGPPLVLDGNHVGNDPHAHVTNSPGLAHDPPLALDGNHTGNDPSSALLSQLQQAKTKVKNLEMELAETAIDLVMTKASLAKEKEKTRRLWQKQFEQHLAHEEEMDEKDAEIEKLKAELEKLRNPGWGPPAREACLTTSAQLEGRSTAPTRVGKALPVDPYTGRPYCRGNSTSFVIIV